MSHPSTQTADSNFKKEVENLSLMLKLRKVPLDKEHQVKFIDLVYSNQEVFSFDDEDLDVCDHLTHRFLTRT